MPDERMNCHEATEEHLVACDNCFVNCLKEFFEPPEPAIPAGFTARTLARLEPPRREPVRVLPYLLFAAGILFAAVGAALVFARVPCEIAAWFTLSRQTLILWIGSAEVILSVAWLWHTTEEE